MDFFIKLRYLDTYRPNKAVKNEKEKVCCNFKLNNQRDLTEGDRPKCCSCWLFLLHILYQDIHFRIYVTPFQENG